MACSSSIIHLRASLTPGRVLYLRLADQGGGVGWGLWSPGPPEPRPGPLEAWGDLGGDRGHRRFLVLGGGLTLMHFIGGAAKRL